MKSRIISAGEYSLDTVAAPGEGSTEATVEAELLAFVRSRSRLEDRQVVQHGDIARLSLKSSVERLNKPQATVAIGLGLLDGELERHLIGAAVGSPRVIDTPEGPVEATVLSAQFQFVPELTDAIVREATDGVYTTVDQYREDRIAIEAARQADEYTTEAAFDLFDQAVDGSEAAIDDGEIATLIDVEMERCRALAAEQGLVFEEMTPEEFGPRVGVETLDEFIAMITDNARRTIVSALLATEVSGGDAGTVPLDDARRLSDDYFQHLRAELQARLDSTQGDCS